MSWICRRPNNCRDFFPIFAKRFVPNAGFIMEFAIRALRTTTQVDVLKKTFALGFGMLRNSTPWGKCSINVAKQRILLMFYKFHTYLLIFIDLSICHEKVYWHYKDPYIARCEELRFISNLALRDRQSTERRPGMSPAAGCLEMTPFTDIQPLDGGVGIEGLESWWLQLGLVSK